MDPNLFERLNCIVLISLMKFDEIVIFFFYDDKTNLVDKWNWWNLESKFKKFKKPFYYFHYEINIVSSFETLMMIFYEFGLIIIRFQKSFCENLLWFTIEINKE